jgi:hypothetical protein
LHDTPQILAVRCWFSSAVTNALSKVANCFVEAPPPLACPDQ